MQRGRAVKAKNQVQAGKASGAARRAASDEERIMAIAMYLDSGYTQAEVARIVGKTQQWLSKIWRAYIVKIS